MRSLNRRQEANCGQTAVRGWDPSRSGVNGDELYPDHLVLIAGTSMKCEPIAPEWNALFMTLSVSDGRKPAKASVSEQEHKIREQTDAASTHAGPHFSLDLEGACD